MERAAVEPGATWELLEALPDEVVASIEVRDAWRKKMAAQHAGLEFIVSDVRRWAPGSVVRVAFLDGDPALHALVAGATAQGTDACNLELDFGHDPVAGTYRRWTLADQQYAAEIRVSFDWGGYWSLVGTDSNDPQIGGVGPIGGGPGQRSLNLGGFKSSRPPGWEGTTRHEFLHALGFHHAHQNMRGPCENEFRWDDDPGYVPTKNAAGSFIPDAAGKRPGIYTYLAGPPNGWPKAKVDHNLRTEDDPEAVAGPFDSDSVMLYRFAAFFYKQVPSTCSPTGNGVDLSAGDERGLRLLYPSFGPESAVLSERAAEALDRIGSVDEAAVDGEPAPRSAYEERLSELLAARASAGR